MVIRQYAESSLKVYQETTPRVEINPRENEYSSMRLLPPLPSDGFGRPHPHPHVHGYGGAEYSLASSGQYMGGSDMYRGGGSEHVYESPDSPHGLRGLSRSDSGPHYFDLDPQELAAVAKSIGADPLDCGPGNVGFVVPGNEQGQSSRRPPQHQLASLDTKPCK